MITIYSTITVGTKKQKKKTFYPLCSQSVMGSHWNKPPSLSSPNPWTPLSVFAHQPLDSSVSLPHLPTPTPGLLYFSSLSFHPNPRTSLSLPYLFPPESLDSSISPLSLFSQIAGLLYLFPVFPPQSLDSCILFPVFPPKSQESSISPQSLYTSIP